MKQEYIRQVARRLDLSKKQKHEILRDLEEMFDSAQEHGESVDQVIHRLGTPEEYAQTIMSQTEVPGKKFGKTLLGLILSCVVGVLCLTLFAVTQQSWVPDNAIGAAQGVTSIQVVGGFDLSPILFVAGTLAFLLALFFVWKLIRQRKRG